MAWLIGMLVLSALPWLLRKDGGPVDEGPSRPDSGRMGNVVPLRVVRLHDRRASAHLR